MIQRSTILSGALVPTVAIACALMAAPAEEPAARTASPGNTIYLIDAAQGDDANPPGRPWRSFARLNALQLAAGDRVEIAPGRYEGTLNPHGEGTAEHPIVIRFRPGVHTIGMEGIVRLPMFISNSCDSPAPKPIGILIQQVKHLRLKGGGVAGADKTSIVYDGRMVQIFDDRSEDISFTGLVFDLKRPTVSEFRVLEAGPAQAVIQVAEGSDYAVENGKFVWTGDWGPGNACQEAIPAEGRCWRAKTPRGWTEHGQAEATATDLGGRKVRLEFAGGDTGLKQGWQYHLGSVVRNTVGVHNARCKDVVFRDCDVYALTGMGFVSQFTEHLTFQRVRVAPPEGTIRTCAAWADILQFSNCRGRILVDDCRFSGMRDDSINCHGTYLRIAERVRDDQLLMRFVHPQTYGFAAFAPGDEIAVMSPDSLREYPGNPHATVAAIERRTDQDWLITLTGPAPRFEKNDVLDNLTWNPDITVRNTSVDMDPVRGFLFGTRGTVVVEGNTFHRCHMAAILVEGDGQYWMESSPIRDLLIQHNHFIACGISIEANTKPKPPAASVHQNIRILDNSFDQVAAPAIRVHAVQGLTVKGNTATAGTAPITVDADKACSEMRVEGN